MAKPVVREVSFFRSLLLIAIGMVVTALPVRAAEGKAVVAQAPATMEGKLEFEVASVKQNKSDAPPSMNFPLGPGDVYVATGGAFSASNLPLIAYILFAYKTTTYQTQALIKQLPSWVTEDRFDIQAKAEDHNPTKDQMRLMMRSLLADRFKMVVHTENQQVPVYAMVLAKPGKMGPKLRLHPAYDTSCSKNPGAQNSAPGVIDGYPVTCGGLLGMPSSAPGRLNAGARNVPMSLITASMTGMGNLGRPVIDQTGLTGNVDFAIEFTPELPAGATPGPQTDSTGPTFLEALQEQLGLKLNSQKGGVDVVIVDHIERPSVN